MGWALVHVRESWAGQRGSCQPTSGHPGSGSSEGLSTRKPTGLLAGGSRVAQPQPMPADMPEEEGCHDP